MRVGAAMLDITPRLGTQLGGHEANEDCTFWAKLAPGSLEKIVDEAVALLREVFP